MIPLTSVYPTSSFIQPVWEIPGYRALLKNIFVYNPLFLSLCRNLLFDISDDGGIEAYRPRVQSYGPIKPERRRRHLKA